MNLTMFMYLYKYICLCLCLCAGRSEKTSSYQSIRTFILWGAATAPALRWDSACRRRRRAATSTVWSTCTLRGRSWASRCTHTYRYTHTPVSRQVTSHETTHTDTLSRVFPLQEKGETALHLAVLLADRTSLHILDFLAQNWSVCSDDV